MKYTPLEIRHTANCKPYPWHPSVIYIENNWNGHKWWMVETPFPPMEIAPYRDRWEVPCIHYSDDGRTWYPVPSNPIDDLDEYMIEAHNYLSDPHLVYKDGVLECWYRITYLKNKQIQGNKTVLVRKVSIDGVTWSNREIIADLRNAKNIEIWGNQIISPAIVWKDNQYLCWYVDRSSYLSDRKIRFVSSVDAKTWINNIECMLQGRTIDPWHIDVQFYDGKYQMLIYDFDSITWWNSVDGIKFSFVSTVLKEGASSYTFYADGLYRACSTQVGNMIYVYFSAKREKKSYIGCLKTKNRINFKPVNGMSHFLWFWINRKDYINYIWQRCKKIAKKVY